MSFYLCCFFWVHACLIFYLSISYSIYYVIMQCTLLRWCKICVPLLFVPFYVILKKLFLQQIPCNNPFDLRIKLFTLQRTAFRLSFMKSVYGLKFTVLLWISKQRIHLAVIWRFILPKSLSNFLPSTSFQSFNPSISLNARNSFVDRISWSIKFLINESFVPCDCISSHCSWLHIKVDQNHMNQDDYKIP